MKEVVLTVIFEGTIYSIEEPKTHLHHVLTKDCAGTRIYSAEQLKEHPNTTHFKMGFNGCAIDFGTMGLLFGSGLDTQYNQVISVVKELIKTGHKVKLNAMGLSRGGVAAILLIKALAEIDSYHLESNLLLLDPVPGNALLTHQLDYFRFTLAEQAMDVSKSKNLKYVETIYPYLEVGDDSEEWFDAVLARLHTPIRPTYPSTTEVHEEVIPGAHLSSFQDDSIVMTKAVHGVDMIPILRQLSKEIIHTFLKKVSALSKEIEEQFTPIIFSRFAEEKEKWRNWLAELIKDIIPKSRPMHCQDGSRIVATNQGTYLNQVHRELENGNSISSEELSLKIIPQRPRVIITVSPLEKKDLEDLLTIVSLAMTPKSKEGKKGKLLKKIQDGLETQDFTEEQLSFILRKIIMIALQRDRNYYSWYNTTTSGEALLAALNTDKFIACRICLKPDAQLLVYSDLACFVQGNDDLTQFISTNKKANLAPIKECKVEEDTYSFYLR